MDTTPSSREVARIGYALVATQFDAEAERNALRRCDEVHVDVVPDPGNTDQPALLGVLNALQPKASDILVVTALKRLAPTFVRLAPIVFKLRELDVHLDIGGTVYRVASPEGAAFVEGLRLACELRVPLSPKRGEPVGRSLLTAEQRSAARFLHKANHMNVVQLAGLFGVHHSTMSRNLRDPSEAIS